MSIEIAIYMILKINYESEKSLYIILDSLFNKINTRRNNEILFYVLEKIIVSQEQINIKPPDILSILYPYFKLSKKKKISHDSQKQKTYLFLEYKSYECKRAFSISRFLKISL